MPPRAVGCAPFVVTDGGARRPWNELGAAATLSEPLDRESLLTALREHASPVERTASSPLELFDDPDSPPSGGRVVTVVGAGGTGTSTVATALAQGLATDPSYGGRLVLVDASLRSSLALLHDSGDVVPGLQELVEAHRADRPDPDVVRAHLTRCDAHGYDLLPGLRRHRDWTVLRPRAVEAAIASLRRVASILVADADGDVEGEAETGSPDIGDRNILARHLTSIADVVVVTGHPGIAGIHDLVRLLAEVVGHGVEPARILPLVNRAPRSGARRAELARSVGLLLGDLAPGVATASPLMIVHRRDIEALQHDGAPLPKALATTMTQAVHAVMRRTAPVEPDLEPTPIVPGSLGMGSS